MLFCVLLPGPFGVWGLGFGILIKTKKKKINNKLKQKMIIEQDQKTPNLDVLIKNNASLTTLFNHPQYLDETYNQGSTLGKYLSSKKKISDLLDWIYQPLKITKIDNKKKNCKYSFYAYTTISNCLPEILLVIIKNSDLMKKLFLFINKNSENLCITSLGYFQEIIKNFLSENNPYLNLFIKVLKINPELYIFPLIQNLTKSNSEIIKEILGKNNTKLKKLQLCVFEFLLYFYLNEKFVVYDNFVFLNLVDIFHFLLKNEDVIIYKYKLKYEFTLYSDDFVINKKFSEPIYFLKLALLNYIAKTKQIKTCQNPNKFLNTFKKFKKSKKNFFYLKELLNFFFYLSNNEEFEENIDFEFFISLFEILKEFSYKDILHDIIFKIFDNLKNFINKNKKSFFIIIDWIFKQKKILVFPNEKGNNKISLYYIYQLLKNLDLETNFEKSPKKNEIKNQKVKKKKNLEKNPKKNSEEKNLEKKSFSEKKKILEEYLKKLEKQFTKLCFTESETNFSEVEEYSDVEVILKKDFHLFFKRNSQIPENPKFHYEDNIKKAEPINNDLILSKISKKDENEIDFKFLPEKNPVDILNSFKEQSFYEGDEILEDKKNNEIEHVLFSSDDDI